MNLKIFCICRTNEDGNNNVNKSSKKRLERRNSRALESVGKLNPPTISDIGHYFDVHVTLAAHPGHFIVQPLADARNLKVHVYTSKFKSLNRDTYIITLTSFHFQMMISELQEYCDKYDGPPLETVSEGKLYAGKFRDVWYRYAIYAIFAIYKRLSSLSNARFRFRVYVTNIISDNEVSIYFCDFGDVTIVSRNNLQPLKSDFLKLPYQAVKAKLVGKRI